MKKPKTYKNGAPKFDIANHTYEVDGETLNFMGLCRHFGVKYQSMYRLVATKGIDVAEAIKICMNDPSRWGY